MHKQILSSNTDLLVGDWNTSPLQLSSVTCDRKFVGMPSYLPSVSYDVSSYPPSVDLMCARTGMFQCVLSPVQIKKLQKVKKNPRGQMKGFPSDHVPVEFLVTKPLEPDWKMRIATWNVCNFDEADHESAKIGFDRVEKVERYSKLLEHVETLLSRNDVLCLQEVPFDFFDSLLLPRVVHKKGYTVESKSLRDKSCKSAYHLVIIS